METLRTEINNALTASAARETYSAVEVQNLLLDLLLLIPQEELVSN